MSNGLNKKCGLYFLLRKGKIVYIGQTTDLVSRMQYHNLQCMDYDCMRFIPCAKDLLSDYERRWISMFKPPENKTNKGRKKPKSYYVKKVTRSKARFKSLNERQMQFRRLTKKSIYGFGNLRDKTVEQMLVPGRLNDAIWIYYSLSHISYVDDLLEELKITGDWKINKPGTNRDKGREFIQKFYPEEYAIHCDKVQRSMNKKARNLLKHDGFASNSKLYNMVRGRGGK